MTHWKSPWCWETLRAGGESDDNRGWDGWVASLTEWTRVWANSGRWWRTGKPGMLQSTGLQRVRHDSVTEQQQRAGWESVEACRRVSWGLGLDGRVHWFHPHSLARDVSRLPWIIMMETGNCSLLFVLFGGHSAVLLPQWKNVCFLSLVSSLQSWSGLKFQWRVHLHSEWSEREEKIKDLHFSLLKILP